MHFAKGNFRVGAILKAALIASVASSCAYRLTNLHVQSPNHVQTIAIESIYDTTSEVLPHEQLWNELQRSFAANGHLKVTSVDKADALLRAHVRLATIEKSGELRENVRGELKKDIDLYQDRGPPIPPGTLRNLSVANTYYMKDRLGFFVDVEVIDLRTRQILLQRTYTRSFEAWAVSETLNEISFVRHEESAQLGFAKASRSIAEVVVTDLLVR